MRENPSLVSVIIFFVLLFVFAKWGPALNFSTRTQGVGEPFVVTGEGKVFVTPDIAKVSFGIQDQGASLKQVQDSVNKKSQLLTAELKRLGIEEKDIKTSSYSVYPQYDYTSPNQRVTGFQVSISYEVTIRNFDKVNEALTAGTAAGANVVGGVSFEVNDKTQKEKLQESRKMAVSEAKEKAEGLADAAGISLGKIINITESEAPSPINFLRSPVAVNLGAPEKEIAEPDVQPGTAEITTSITLSYEVR